ncbi:MAG: hypothetical protein D6796_11990, partial [Caldilineae bacterium]
DTFRQINDAGSTFAVLARLGRLALARGRRDEALSLLQEARRGFARLGFTPWVEQIDQLLASLRRTSEVRRNSISLDDLLALVRAARAGNSQAGRQAWEICQGLARSGDETLAALGHALQRLLAGLPPAEALSTLPEDLRRQIQSGL